MRTCCQSEARPHCRVAASGASGDSRKAGFTLIELLVVIAIVALLVGILVPALANARKTAKAIKCATNLKGHGLSFNLYAGDYKGWNPVIPIQKEGIKGFLDPDPAVRFLSQQWRYGGVAGMYSLFQNPDGGLTTATGDFGYVGPTASFDPAKPPFYAVFALDGNGTEFLKTRIYKPLMHGYLDGYAALRCPLHAVDYAVTSPDNAMRGLNKPDADVLPGLTSGVIALKQVRDPGAQTDVIRYNVSYIYIAGFKSDEPTVIKPAPLFGDETRGLDVSGRAWYGRDTERPLDDIKPGFQYRWDAHGAEGAQYVFTDGHVELVKYNVQDTFFTTNKSTSQSVNVIDNNRSKRLQTID